MTNNPWRTPHFGNGFSAEFLPLGERSWRIVKSGGKPIEFPTRRAAEAAAINALALRSEGNIRSTIPVDPERLEAKLSAEAEKWLRSDRRDTIKAETVFRPGKRPFKAVHGKASV